AFLQSIIPANDDAFKSISLIVNYIGSVIEDGLNERKKEKEEANQKREAEAKKAADAKEPAE
ncbi:MAG: 30S ribosomal protein S2, partial [Bacteroidota bacterium]